MYVFRSSLAERMPVLDEATFSGRRAGSVPAAVSTSKGVSVNLPNGAAKPSIAPVADLLDLTSDDAPAPSSSGGEFLQDLLGVNLTPVSLQSGHICYVLHKSFRILFLIFNSDHPHIFSFPLYCN